MKVQNDDAQIDVRVDGDGDETIVLIHGFPLTREIWDAQAQALARTYRVVRPDLRGMGSSRVIDGPYLMESLAGDIAATLDALGIERATLVGHSLGGYVALAFARMYLERLRRLALVCSRITADSAERIAFRYDLANNAERSNSNEEIVEAMLAQLLAPQRFASDSALVERVRAIAARNDPKGLAAMLRGMALRDSAEDIAPDLDLPVLIVAGGQDPSIPPEETRAMAGAFPAAQLVVCEASGHLPMLEEPEAVTRALVTFMSA